MNELEHAERYVSECSEGMQNIMRCVATMSDCEEYQAFRLAPEESRCADEDARVVEHCGWHF